jgi:putative ABC transport system permease protein
MMNATFNDIRHALRQMRKSPGFTLTVLLTLALGIGANTAVFTLFDQAMLRRLPVARPQELVRFEWSGGFSGTSSSFGGGAANYFSYPMYKDLRDRNQVFNGMLAADRTSVALSWRNQAESEDAEIVSGNYFQVLGLRPALGRLFTQQDDTAKDANFVAVLSYNYWKSRFAASPDVIGQTVLVNGHPFAIVGVAPQNFDSAIGGFRPGVFLPVSMVDIAIPWRADLDDLNNHQSIFLTLVARLKPGVSRTQAEASLGPLWHTLRAYELTLYKTNNSQRFRESFLDQSHLKVLDDAKGFSPDRTELEKPLAILMSMAGLLVILCAINVATLLLLRAAARAREMSMRYALGARRSHIVLQLLIEGGLLGAAGAAAGVALAPMVSTILVRLITSSDPGSEPYSAAIDGRILLFTLAVSLLATLLFSIAPVFHFLRPDLVNGLRQSAGTASRNSQRFRKLAVGVQIALGVLLLGGAGLFVRTLDHLRHQDVGFALDHLVTFSLDPSSSGYGEERTNAIVSSSLEAVRRIPGVVSAAATTDPELSNDSETSNFSVLGYKPSEEENMDFEDAWATPGYFATLRQPLLAGREFAGSDAKGQPLVAIVNLSFARRFFGTPQNVLGHLIAQGAGDVKFNTTIVGVVGNTRHRNMRTPLEGAIYRPFLQMDHPTGVRVYARTAEPPQIVEPAIRRAMHQLDSTLVVGGLRTMQDQEERSTSDESALAFLSAGFAALALVLAAVGLYGVLAYSTEQRTREIGVRLALGSPRSSVIALVVREMGWIAAAATAVALPSVVALARLFRSQLYGVASFDPLSLAGAVALTALMVALAAALPARRAARVQPMQALRTE